MKTFTLINHEEPEDIKTLTVEEILEEVNRDRSEEWTDYDDKDWVEGVLQMTEYGIIFPKGQRMYFISSVDDRHCEVVINEMNLVKSINDNVVTDSGEFKMHELFPID